MSIEISDWNAEEDPRRFIDIIRSHLNFFFLGARGLSPSLDEIFCPRFETAILLDQFKTALIELADESLQGLNVFLRLVERRHL